jgi:DNA/RNA-binding domain of Phe-tRNA-synthetase-like protein
MNFFVEQAVLDVGVKILFAEIHGVDNHAVTPEWITYRQRKLSDLFARYENLDVHTDPILEGFNVLHDRVGVKRRKNVPASENLIKLLEKHHDLPLINQAVDIYNLVSLESKLALGAMTWNGGRGHHPAVRRRARTVRPHRTEEPSRWRRGSTATATSP